MVGEGWVRIAALGTDSRDQTLIVGSKALGESTAVSRGCVLSSAPLCVPIRWGHFLSPGSFHEMCL